MWCALTALTVHGSSETLFIKISSVASGASSETIKTDPDDLSSFSCNDEEASVREFCTTGCTP